MLGHQKLGKDKHYRKEALLDMSYVLVPCNGEIIKLKTYEENSRVEIMTTSVLSYVFELRTTKKRKSNIQASEWYR